MSGRRRSATVPARGAVNVPEDSVYYTWTCPICDVSRTSFTREGQTMHQALNALRAHVSTSEGNGHGRRNAYPDGLDREQLVEQVSFDGADPR